MVIYENEIFKSNLSFFEQDLQNNSDQINNIIKSSSFLIIGGAGTIGQSVVKELFVRSPKIIHVIDISENNLVELVRDLRSSVGYIKGDFKTFCLDCGSDDFEVFMNQNNGYDYVLNLSALKHVRSEKDPYSLMRMINVNIFNTIKTLKIAEKYGCKNYFCVSTDKATNPANLMGASKRVMELFLLKEAKYIKVSTARFANVAFSDGSLLDGFLNRYDKLQPITAPSDIKRYFIKQQDAGILCIFSSLFGKKNDIFFPKIEKGLELISLEKVARIFLANKGYKVYECENEDEARSKTSDILSKREWPCYFFKSDTSGEKPYEEFFEKNQNIDNTTFETIGIIKNVQNIDHQILENFISRITELKLKNKWFISDFIELFSDTLSNFHHISTGKNLDNRM